MPLITIVWILLQRAVSHTKTATRLDNLKNELDSLIDTKYNDKLININGCTTRCIQDEIFRHQSSSHSIPDTFLYIFQKNMKS